MTFLKHVTPAVKWDEADELHIYSYINIYVLYSIFYEFIYYGIVIENIV